MNDSSWQPEPVPAGPAYDAQVGPHTRPMPIVPDAAGRDFDDREARDRGRPAWRSPLPRRDAAAGAHAQPPPPSSQAPQNDSPPPKKRAGRDLRAAIGVGVGLGAVIFASLFIVKAVFVGVIAVAVVVGLWELTSRLQEQKGIKAPLVPLAVGGAAMVIAGYVRGAEGAWSRWR